MSKLIDTLKDALEIARDHRATILLAETRFRKALEALSTPDALAWALLEEMAEERVEVSELGKSPTEWIRRFQLACEPRGIASVIKFQIGNVDVRLRTNEAGSRTWTITSWLQRPAALGDLILCLVLALQEQRNREQERAVVDDFRGRISAALERGDLVKNPNGSLSISREVSGE